MRLCQFRFFRQIPLVGLLRRQANEIVATVSKRPATGWRRLAWRRACAANHWTGDKEARRRPTCNLITRRLATCCVLVARGPANGLARPPASQPASQQQQQDLSPDPRRRAAGKRACRRACRLAGRARGARRPAAGDALRAKYCKLFRMRDHTHTGPRVRRQPSATNANGPAD